MTLEYTKPPEPNWRKIKLNDDYIVIVDDYIYDFLRQYPWKVYRHQRCYYAKYTRQLNNRQVSVYMHRLIAKTPSGETCHHRNRQTLDNRRKNLVNMSKDAHRTLHQNNTLLIQFAKLGPDTIDLPKFYGT